MTSETTGVVWDFESALDLIQRLAEANKEIDTICTTSSPVNTVQNESVIQSNGAQPAGGLGDFSEIWQYLDSPNSPYGGEYADARGLAAFAGLDKARDSDTTYLGKGVRWRDEIDGADLEDNAEPLSTTSASLKTLKRAQRRNRAKERARQLLVPSNADSTESATSSDTDEDLKSFRRSPDRRALVASIIGRPLPHETNTPPTSPSPPKVEIRTPLKSFPVSNPTLWTAAGTPSSQSRIKIAPNDGLSAEARKAELIRRLSRNFPEERRYLSNSGLMQPEFSLLNTSDLGVHVFIDMSNISIGFHDCLKARRKIPISERVRRVPMSFHNFSLVLERGRPASRRALAGSDRTSVIDEAESTGYEINILERVHKAKQLTPKQKKYMARSNGNGGNTSASGVGETSGSETYQGYSSSGAARSQFLSAVAGSHSHAAAAFPSMFAPSKWVEQGVDEILHLKILESVIDAKKPSVIVLATGDAAEAEYSAGFLRMVERALEKGWVVELVSFEMNTSSAYKKPQFRNRWGPMFRWVKLDDYVEFLIRDEVTNISSTSGNSL